MQIREAFFEDFEELMEFYERMCRALGEKDFLPEGDKGGFPYPLNCQAELTRN